MRIEDFDYPLPPELIAQTPLSKRDRSKLLVVARAGNTLQDKTFSDILSFLGPQDVLVLNDTKVLPARILAHKKGTMGKVELLLLEELDAIGCELARSLLEKHSFEGVVWRCLIQPVLNEGQQIVVGELEAVYLGRAVDGIALLGFPKGTDVMKLAYRIGQMPLPPYIKRSPQAADEDQYQTVYAAHPGAVAAPTAGLHFTPELLKAIAAQGTQILTVTLHVGYGTFKPVHDTENHAMHKESFELSPETADAINKAKSAGKKIWAVGTTTLRTLETCVQNRRLIPGKGQTDLFIKPPFEFEAVDRLITNFHLPRTTLLLLVSAFIGEELRQKAYAHAVAQRYRFYSYGDAMVIL